MKCREIIEILETLAPKSCACDWDNPGLLAGRMDKDVKKILLTLDADDAAVERAKEIGADMLLSHHPLIFKPVKHVSDEDFIGRRLVSLIQEDVSYYAMHGGYCRGPAEFCGSEAAGAYGRAFGNCLWNRKDRNFEETDDGSGACERGEEPVWTAVCHGLRE